MGILRVASASETTAVAGAIAWRIRDEGCTEMEAIGAAAVNQAVKAIAVARTYLEPDGLDLVVIPRFVTVGPADAQRTALRLAIESREARQPAAEEDVAVELGVQAAHV
jgi:stage V sporulation protein S